MNPMCCSFIFCFVFFLLFFVLFVPAQSENSFLCTYHITLDTLLTLCRTPGAAAGIVLVEVTRT